MISRSLVLLFLFAIQPVLAVVEWQDILALDAGPPQKPATAEEARSLGIAHLERTERLLRQFLEAHPGSPQEFEARLRLASVDAARGKILNRQSLVDQSMRSLADLEKDVRATRGQRADAAFRRVSLLMQSLQGLEIPRREDLVHAARRFKNLHPSDPRAARVLVEVATVCDAPQRRELLEEALPLAREEALQRRIADDLRRLEQIGRSLKFDIPSADGRSLSAAGGRPTIVIFWASDSLPCLLWMRSFRQARLPLSQVRVVTVSLDTDPAAARRALDDAGFGDWPILCDGKGWNGPWVRSLGLNALPSVWITDRQGIVRTTDARNNFEPWLRKVLSSP